MSHAPSGDETTALPVSDDLEWLIAALWDRPGVTARLGSAGPDGAGETYAVVPSAARARFLLPARAPRAAAASLRSYNRLRPRRVRMARNCVALATRLGAGRLVAGDTLSVTYEDPERSLVEAIRRLLNTNDVLFSIGLPPRGPNRKPVLQVFSPEGQPLAFVKVGWNDVTRARVKKESQALAAWSDRPSGRVRVPRLLHGGPVAELLLSVTAPLPLDVQRVGPSEDVPLHALREIWESGEVELSPLASSSYVERSRARALALADAGRRSSLVGLLASATDRYGDLELSFGTCHGDWTPWNLARRGEVVYAFDWEHWATDAPLGLDVVHWFFQLAFIVDEQPLHDAWYAATAAARPELGKAGISRHVVDALGPLYLVEMGLRAAESVEAGGTPNPRWENAIESLIAHLGVAPT